MQRPLNYQPGIEIHVNNVHCRLPPAGSLVLVREVQPTDPPGVCLLLEWAEADSLEAGRHTVRSQWGIFLPLPPSPGSQRIPVPVLTHEGWRVEAGERLELAEETQTSEPAEAAGPGRADDPGGAAAPGAAAGSS